MRTNVLNVYNTILFVIGAALLTLGRYSSTLRWSAVRTSDATWVLGAPEALARFNQDGIALKVLSGDDPDTVAALAARAGLSDAEPVHAGHLAHLDDAELDAVVARGAVFGRVAPEQKERIVASLRRQGRYVAMVGDGVNDARALKAAQVGVAMRSGSAVTRDVADIVLVDDSLSALLPTRRHGRRIISGLAISTQLFLTRVATQTLVIVAITMLGLGFPYSPAQTGLTLFTVGLPTIFLTAWARPTAPDRHLLINLARFVLPAAVITAGAGVGVYTLLYTGITHGFTDPAVQDNMVAAFQRYTGLTYGVDADFEQAAATIGAQTGLSTFVSLAHPSQDKRPAALVIALLTVLLGALVTPTVSDYFGLTGPARPVYQIVLPVLLLWFLALWTTYRYRIFDRVLGLQNILRD